jgi:hypothetical protein
MRSYLDTQLSCYQRILELSRKQSEAIAGDETSELMQVLTRKQEVMREVEASGAGAGDLLQEWEAVKPQLTAADREPVEQAHEEVKEVLAEVLRLEEEGRTALASRTGDKGGKLRNMQRGKQMLKAYGRGAPNRGSHYTDNKK